MSETPQSLGLLQPIHIGGFNLVLNPATISEVPFRAETAERVANSFTVVDRPYLSLSGVPPDVVQKMVWTLAWPSVNSSDYNVFTEIESLPGFFDFCIWKSLIETFSGDGSSKIFSLLRRRADTALTPPSGVTWTPVTKIAGSVVANPSFGSADAVLGVTPVTFSSAPTSGTSNIRISYTPLYYVRVVSPKRDFAIPFVESRSLSLEEI